MMNLVQKKLNRKSLYAMGPYPYFDLLGVGIHTIPAFTIKEIWNLGYSLSELTFFCTMDHDMEAQYMCSYWTYFHICECPIIFIS